MRVLQIKNNDNQKFKAKRATLINVKLPEKTFNYELYRITEKDSKFLNKIKSEIDLKKLWGGLKYFDYAQWQLILERALEFPSSNDKFGYLLFWDNKPCGAMNCRTISKGYYVDYVSTWPVQQDKKAPLAGKVLFMQLFLDMLKNKKDFIKLNSVRNDPFNAMTKYLALNFKPLGGDESCEIMKIQKEMVPYAIKKFANIIKITPQKEDEVDLMQVYGKEVL